MYQTGKNILLTIYSTPVQNTLRSVKVLIHTRFQHRILHIAKTKTKIFFLCLDINNSAVLHTKLYFNAQKYLIAYFRMFLIKELKILIKRDLKPLRRKAYKFLNEYLNMLIRTSSLNLHTFVIYVI